MPHVWMRYLNERQEQDYEVILGDIELEKEKVDELNDVDTSSPSDSFDDEVAYQPLATESDPKSNDNVYTGIYLALCIYIAPLHKVWLMICSVSHLVSDLVIVSWSLVRGVHVMTVNTLVAYTHLCHQAQQFGIGIV